MTSMNTLISVIINGTVFPLASRKKQKLPSNLFELGCATWLIMNNKLALHNGSDCTEENNTLIYSLLGNKWTDNPVHCERYFLLYIEEIP